MQSKVIEAFLQTVDGATFQHLMNHLLQLEGYKFIGSPGSVIGKNKTSKGSPDSFFEDREKLIFCEFTTLDRLTNEKTFFAKLEKDIEHCFNVKETGVKKTDISKVILGFTGEVKSDELQALKARVKTHHQDAELVIYSIHHIPFRLLYYPGLADRYVPGINTNNGTIYMVEDFIKTTKGKIQPSLVNPFFGRGAELFTIKEKLRQTNILLLTGGQGVGKSKLAICVAESMAAEGYEARVVIPSFANLWDHMTQFILPGKKYIIVFDDANKALNNLQYVLGFLSDREEGQIKLIITVRDYVKHDLDKYLIDLQYDEFEIQPFGGVDLGNLLETAIPDGYTMDRAYIEQITGIAKGNARLAMMALNSVLEGGDKNYLKNVAGLYDHYFKKLGTELSVVNNPNKLKALGILSFFEQINFTNDRLRFVLADRLQIDLDEIRETLLELEQSELVDFYNRDLCKISDQVLATFSFYKTFLDPQSAVIDYADWVVTFFPELESRVRRTLVDANNTFGHAEIKKLVLPFLIRYRATILGDEALMFRFYLLFWAYLENDTLIFIGNQLEKVPDLVEPELDAALKQLHVKEFFIPLPLIELLKPFWQNLTGFAVEALRLCLKLLLKLPGRTVEVCEELNDSFKFNRFDHISHYQRQTVYMDWLCSADRSDAESWIIDHVFLHFVPVIFSWEFFEHSNNGFDQVIHNAHLIKCPELMAIRRKALVKIIDLVPHGALDQCRSLMPKYIRPGQGFDYSILAEEADLIIPFLINAYSPANFNDITFVNEYIEIVEPQGVIIPVELAAFRANQLVETADLLLYSAADFMSKDFDEVERQKKASMVALGQSKDFEGVKLFFREAEALYLQDGNTGGNSYWIELAMTSFIEGVFNNSADLFLDAIDYLIEEKLTFVINLHGVISYPLFYGIDADKFYAVISGNSYTQMAYWKSLFFSYLPAGKVNRFFLLEFINLLQNLPAGINFPDLDFLKRYETIFETHIAELPVIGPDLDNIYTYVTQLLLTKMGSQPVRIDRNLGDKFGTAFSKRPDLLTSIYTIRSSENDFDRQGKELKILLKYQPEKVIDFVRFEVDATPFDESRLYKFDLIWDLPDATQLLEQALEIVIDKKPFLSTFEHPINALFKKRQHTPEHRSQALDFIHGHIDRHQNDKSRIHYIFNVISHSYSADLVDMLKYFIQLNTDSEFVKELFLKKAMVMVGDPIPYVDAEINLYKDVIKMVGTLPDTIRFVGHIDYWQGVITGLESSRKAFEIRNFTRF